MNDREQIEYAIDLGKRLASKEILGFVIDSMVELFGEDNMIEMISEMIEERKGEDDE